ncbi:hypothetical protein Hanom_Chr06g00541731 [Helianthus anomalus]
MKNSTFLFSFTTAIFLIVELKKMTSKLRDLVIPLKQCFFKINVPHELECRSLI